MSDTPRVVRVVTPPAGEPVTLAEAKLWCRIDDDDTTQDAMLLLLITGMREYAEEITGRAFVQRTLQLRLRAFPDGEVELPHPPLRSVTSIDYTDGDGAEQNLNGSPSEYTVDIYAEPGIVKPSYGSNWPTARDDVGTVRITYTCGYDSASKIPAKVRLWMQARISTIFENREQLISNGMVEIPRDFADGLLDGLRITRMFA